MAITSTELRKNLRLQFEKYFRIDRWGLGMPDEIRNYDSPPSLGRERSVAEILAIEQQVGSSQSTAYQVREVKSVQALYRLPRTLKPEDRLRYLDPFTENTIAFCGFLQTNPEVIGADSVEASARISCPELVNKDWLLTNNLTLTVVYWSHPFVAGQFG